MMWISFLPSANSLKTRDPLSMAAATLATVPSLSDSDSASNSDADDPSSTTAFEHSIFSSYLQLSSNSAAADLAKIKSFLSTSFTTCLICLGRIRPSDPVWSCSASCHALFHLPCIQSWAHQSSLNPKPNSNPSPTPWHCPKCRHEFPRSQTPRSYRCFCGKLEDPPLDPWILPHSCGEICGRGLVPGCGHRCLLLCHPGPCPPCPQFISTRCFCGARADTRRCAQKRFSCLSPCPNPLPCNTHRCSEKCHDGPCPPCKVKGKYKCACGKSEEIRECHERGFRCVKECEGMLKCGRHKCERGCHEGECGECLLRGRRTCPCGKKEYKGVPCDVEVANCGSTCEKMLGCGRHQCPERCHRGPCVETCRTVVMKACRCGSLKKEVPCYQDLVCERKCQWVRDCGRHACRRRCCDGNCPPCPEICGRKLRCNNHKCPSPCHRGDCAPCPLMVTISCACGETHFEVPCGVERSQKPPRCPKQCHISRLCRHISESRPHKCHYGACPPCKLICGEELSCGHTCKQRCHGPIPPPNPEFTLKPKKKKRPAECVPGSSCSPCQEVIWMPCLGQHIGEDRPMVCSKRMPFSCQNLCGNLLPCSNHSCTRPCHVLKLPKHEEKAIIQQQEPFILPLNVEGERAGSCEVCFLPCQKVREPKCPHPCPLPCHPNDCPPCKALIKRTCHCGSMVHVFECLYFNSLSDKEKQSIRSCGGPCHRKLPNCPHLCSETCHPGECPSIDQCIKKVTARCGCNNLKKDWRCQDALTAYRKAGRDPKDITKSQFGIGLIPCNEECRSKVKVVEPVPHLRKAKVTQDAVVDAEKVPKRRKRREKVQEIRQVSKFQEIKRTLWICFLLLLVSLSIFAISYYGYKGIYWLSDWMNKIEEKQQRRRYPKD